MPDSETSSSEVKVKYINSNSEKMIDHKPTDKNPKSTDTDYYFNMIANPNKIITKPKSSESSELDDILKDTDSDKSLSSSKNSICSSKTSSSNKLPKKSNSDSDSDPPKKNNSDSEPSRKSNSDSKPKYDQINISPKIPIFKNFGKFLLG